MQLWPPAGHFTWQHCWPSDRYMGGGNTRQCFIWKIKVIQGKGRGIVANMHVPKGTLISMYGGYILDMNKVPEGGGSHVWQIKES